MTLGAVIMAVIKAVASIFLAVLSGRERETVFTDCLAPSKREYRSNYEYRDVKGRTVLRFFIMTSIPLYVVI